MDEIKDTLKASLAQYESISEQLRTIKAQNDEQIKWMASQTAKQKQGEERMGYIAVKIKFCAFIVSSISVGIAISLILIK